MKFTHEMTLAEVTLAILKAAVNIPDGLYVHAARLAKQELATYGSDGNLVDPALPPRPDEPDFKSDENALEIFSKLMAHKMAKSAAQGRNGWQHCSQEALSRMLREHVEKGDPVDVANYCMMLCANGFGIAAPAEDVRAVGDEPVAWRGCNSDGDVVTEWIDGAPPEKMFDLCGNAASFDKIERAYSHPQRSFVMPEKYDDVLLPFLVLMRAELHANAHKGDRPGWLSMDRKTAVLEVFYHMGKLHQAVHRDEAAAIREYAADVANMCMMLTDVCGCLDEIARLNPEISK